VIHVSHAHVHIHLAPWLTIQLNDISEVQHAHSNAFDHDFQSVVLAPLATLTLPVKLLAVIQVLLKV
jgi:hypothetical protein